MSVSLCGGIDFYGAWGCVKVAVSEAEKKKKRWMRIPDDSRKETPPPFENSKQTKMFGGTANYFWFGSRISAFSLNRIG